MANTLGSKVSIFEEINGKPNPSEQSKPPAMMKSKGPQFTSEVNSIATKGMSRSTKGENPTINFCLVEDVIFVFLKAL